MNARPLMLAAALCAAGATSHAESEPAPPNILFFLTDDESWLERSAYGWSKLPTPAFDRVAREGVLFTNGFTSAPSCAPSRASVLTGHHFWELEQGAFIQAFIPKKYPIVTRILARHGYQVGRTGKGWGPGSHAKLGIPSDSLGKTFMSEEIPDPPEGVRATDYAANFDRFLESLDPQRPFFFWAGIIEPHEPSGPTNYKLLEKEFGVTLDQVSLPPFLEDTEANRRKRANFVYEICRADTHLARMLKSLEAAGKLDNTLVVVTSDNGTAIVHDGSAAWQGLALRLRRARTARHDVARADQARADGDRLRELRRLRPDLPRNRRPGGAGEHDRTQPAADPRIGQSPDASSRSGTLSSRAWNGMASSIQRAARAARFAMTATLTWCVTPMSTSRASRSTTMR